MTGPEVEFGLSYWLLWSAPGLLGLGVYALMREGSLGTTVIGLQLLLLGAEAELAAWQQVRDLSLPLAWVLPLLGLAHLALALGFLRRARTDTGGDDTRTLNRLRE